MAQPISQSVLGRHGAHDRPVVAYPAAHVERPPALARMLPNVMGSIRPAGVREDASVGEPCKEKPRVAGPRTKSRRHNLHRRPAITTQGDYSPRRGRRMAVNFARLPELLGRGDGGRAGHCPPLLRVESPSPGVGDPQPQEAERPAAGLHGLRLCDRESDAHDPGKRPDRDPVRPQCRLRTPVRCAGEQLERPFLCGVPPDLSWLRRQVADAAARAEANGVVELRNEQLSASRDML
jgi:hypothetical protein